MGAGPSGSLSCCYFQCVLSQGSFTFASHTRSHFLFLSRCLGDPRSSERVFFNFFSEGFSDRRVHSYPIKLGSGVFFFVFRAMLVFAGETPLRGTPEPSRIVIVFCFPFLKKRPCEERTCRPLEFLAGGCVFCREKTSLRGTHLLSTRVFGRGRVFPEKDVPVDNTWGDTGKIVFNNWLGAIYQLTDRDRRRPFMPGVDPNEPLASIF